jgi:hypothetical protein
MFAVPLVVHGRDDQHHLNYFCYDCQVADRFICKIWRPIKEYTISTQSRGDVITECDYFRLRFPKIAHQNLFERASQNEHGLLIEESHSHCRKAYPKAHSVSCCPNVKKGSNSYGSQELLIMIFPREIKRNHFYGAEFIGNKYKSRRTFRIVQNSFWVAEMQRFLNAAAIATDCFSLSFNMITKRPDVGINRHQFRHQM